MGKLKIVKCMERVSFILKMDLIIKELSKVIKRMGKVDISIIMDVFIKGKLRKIRLTVLELIMIHIKVIIMKDNGYQIHLMEKVNKSFQMVPIMKEILTMVKEMDMADMFLIQASMKGTLKLGSSMVKEHLFTLTIESMLETGKMG